MKALSVFLLSLCLLVITASAQAVTTGDAALDESLNSLNEQVKDNPEGFIKVNLALRFNQPAEQLIGLMKNDKLEVSEVFVSSYFAASMNKDLNTVMNDFKISNKKWSQFLVSYKIVKGNKEYRKLLKASINVHPKPFVPKIK